MVFTKTPTKLNISQRLFHIWSRNKQVSWGRNVNRSEQSWWMLGSIWTVVDTYQTVHESWLHFTLSYLRARWQRQTVEDHKYHVKNVAFRGIIELFCQTGKSTGHKVYLICSLSILLINIGNGNLQKLSCHSILICFQQYLFVFLSSGKASCIPRE